MKITSPGFSKCYFPWKNPEKQLCFDKIINKKTLCSVDFFQNKAYVSTHPGDSIGRYVQCWKTLIVEVYIFFRKVCELSHFVAKIGRHDAEILWKKYFSIFQCMECLSSNFWLKRIKIQRERIFWKQNEYESNGARSTTLRIVICKLEKHLLLQKNNVGDTSH